MPLQGFSGRSLQGFTRSLQGFSGGGGIYFSYSMLGADIVPGDPSDSRLVGYRRDGSFIQEFGDIRYSPGGVTFANNRFYVCDVEFFFTDCTVYVYEKDGTLVTQFNVRDAALDIASFNNELYVTSAHPIGEVNVYSNSGTLDRSWTCDSGFPLGIAEFNGEIYVSQIDDRIPPSPTTAEIVVYDTDGNVQRRWGTYGSGDGQFLNPYGIACYNSEVYVSELSRIQVFDTIGNFVRGWSQPNILNRSGISVKYGRVFVLKLNGSNIAIDVVQLDGTLVSTIETIYVNNTSVFKGIVAI